MSKQLFEGLLHAFKRANVVRKQTLAIKAGYATPEEYKQFLESMVNNIPISQGISAKVASKPIPTIHVVDILDLSSSMNGPKLQSAIAGINSGVERLREDETLGNANYTYSLCTFSDYDKIRHPYLKTALNKVEKFKSDAQGMTALNDAIGKTLEVFEASTNKVLINIYTDGDENNSKLYSHNSIKSLIKSVEGNITVTFIGTKFDVETVVSRLGINESNTLAYDGTGDGLAKTMSATRSARTQFATMVSEGKDVSIGFYKNVIKK